jgi:hypothetical protein
MSKRVTKNHIVHNRPTKAEHIKSEDDDEFSKAFDNWKNDNDVVIDGEEAKMLWNMLEDPEKYNPNFKAQQKFIREALKEFPDPEEPTEIDIDL